MPWVADLHETSSFRTGMIFKSMTVVRTASYVPNILPIPKVSNIMKNMILHSWVTSIVDMASVKAMKVKPGPLATSSKKTFKSQVALVIDCVSRHLLKLTVAYNEK